MTTITNSPVTIGDKIIPLPVRGDDWYGIDEFYRDKPGTVTEVYDDSVLAEFASRQKPDDSVSLLVCRWRKRPTAGDSVRVIDEDFGDMFGKIGHVETDDKTSLPYWVKGLYADNPGRGIWFTEKQVEVVQDGETLTVSGPFRKGETLVITGREDQWNGREVVYVGPEFGSRSRHEVTHNGDTLYFSETQLTRPDVEAEPEIVKELRFQLERANERVSEYADRAGKWERDFMRSWERVGREATERDWCDEYERVVSDVQGELEIGEIPARDEEVEITYRERVEIEVDRSFTARLPRGYDSSDIERLARERSNDASNDPDRSDIIEAVRNGSYSCEGYVEDSADEN